MTAVIYARYSSDNQREESIEGQIRECTAYAEKNGITIVKEHTVPVLIITALPADQGVCLLPLCRGHAAEGTVRLALQWW